MQSGSAPSRARFRALSKLFSEFQLADWKGWLTLMTNEKGLFDEAPPAPEPNAHPYIAR
jgi:hypothetical protein